MSLRTQLLAVAVATPLLLGGVFRLFPRHGEPVRRSEASPLREVTDMTGEQVRIPATPRRVLSLCSSATETVLSLGGADSLVAIDEFSLVVPGCQRAIVVGKGSAISRERIASLKIDLAFLWWYQNDAAALLKDLSIPVVRIRSERVARLPIMIRLIGDCLDRRAEAEKLARVNETLVQRSMSQAGARPKAYLEFYSPYKTAGSDTYANDLLELAGCANVAAEFKGYAVLSAEQLVAADPDVVLSVGDVDAQSLARRPGLSQLRAVRQGRVIALDRYWLVAGSNLPESVSKIRNAIAQSAAKP
ncbi:MAG: ABC transporter substrate-binding protein [Isosphaeraceae bacterium]